MSGTFLLPILRDVPLNYRLSTSLSAFARKYSLACMKYRPVRSDRLFSVLGAVELYRDNYTVISYLSNVQIFVFCKHCLIEGSG